MNATNPANPFATRPHRLTNRIASASAIVLGLWSGGCMKGNPPPVTSGMAAGSIVAQPDPLIGSKTFVVDENQGGQGSSVKLKALYWGRLVNVRDRTGTIQNQRMVIGGDIQSDFIDFILDTNAITEETTVTIRYRAGTPEYEAAFHRLDQSLTAVVDRSLDPSEVPPFTLLPRNAALVLKFDDLIDNATIQRETLRVVSGYPATAPFDYRVLADINHGDLFDADGDQVLEFHTTRAILDLTVSALEAGQSNPPPPVNNLGLPASVNTSQANVAVRIPTHLDATIGQTKLLSNLAGASLSFTGNGSTDGSVSTDDIVRAMRSGGNTAVTGDPQNGFLADQIPPKLVGVQPIQISSPAPSGVANEWVTTIDYTLDFCAAKLKLGDVIQQTGVYAEVTRVSDPPVGGTVVDAHFRIVSSTLGIGLAAGPAQIYSVWDPVANVNQPGCFVRYSSVAPGATTPGQGVAGSGRVLVRFSEPMDPSSVTAFDNLPVLRVDPTIATASARDYVIGQVDKSADLKEFSFKPIINYKHTFGTATDRYWVKVGSGVSGPTDLSGRPLADALPSVSFTIDPSAPSEANGGVVFRFSSQDELNDDGKPEWRGQTAPDLTAGNLSPRPVTRMRATCDRTIQVPGAMTPIPQGLQTPLSGLGSKLQALWRYCDVGFGLLDESVFNVDVEHLYWAPAGGNVVSDSFNQFEIRLSHTKVLPDETINPLTGAPVYPGSGLSDVFDDNLLHSTQDPQAVVHPKLLGYVIDPSTRRPSGTGATTVMPYPLNETIPVSQYKYYTWRDTSLTATGAIDPAMPGAELPTVVALSGVGIAGCPYSNATGNNPAPSIALPLLMEFRCFVDNDALGLNALDVNAAVNGFARPNFRAFSTGGTNSSGQPVTINPDLESSAHGGFNPTSTPAGGPTLAVDNISYMGEMDLVLRISRMHSVWLDTLMNSPTYVAPVIEPRDSDQPAGTSIEIAYRAATLMTPPTANIARDANFLDFYGNAALCPQAPPPPPLPPCTAGPCSSNGIAAFLGGIKTWHTSITELNTAKYFQVRVTFISNTDTNLSPTLSALGFAFRGQ